jgi:transposase-like protein
MFHSINNYMTLIQPKPMQCTACGTTGVQPTRLKQESRTQIIVEARYVCPKCNNYFFRGIISCIDKPAPAK